MKKICLSWELVNKMQQCLLQHLKSVIKNTKRPKLERFSACNFPAVLACTSLWVSSAGLFFHVHHQLVIIAILKAMPDGSLEAGMQLVYERKSCNITLHRDLSGPTQRTLLLPAPRLHPTAILSSSPRQPSQFQLPVPAEWPGEGLRPWESRDICILKQMAYHQHLWPFTYANEANTQGKSKLWTLSPAYSCTEVLFKTPELQIYLSEYRSAEIPQVCLPFLFYWEFLIG